MPVIKAEYGPTLPQLLAPKSLAVRAVAAAAATLIAGVALYVVIATRPDETVVLVRKPVTFNLVHGDEWKAAHARGALVSLRHERRGLFLDSYTVRDLRLPAYEGAASGMLPVFANSHVRALGSRYQGFEFVGEGRARINNAIGYEVTFRAHMGERRLYGRHYLLVEEEPEGRRRGVVIELISTPAAGTPVATEIGNHGALK
ncbi:MAG TPA: hypothetical protein VGV67_11885, partial [Solirubrobacteraceae bacterium]|nr:hypothetical protein [Solirubrobacteraceae bacterium]